MGDESSKTKATWKIDILSLLVGRGLDIGAGSDPITPDAKVFDKSDGDANYIDLYIKEKFDWVFSSHCLEHMLDPHDALRRWWGLLKPGGYLILIIPDEDLYEQGYWPSLFNEDHKHTFTMNRNSWSPVSVRIEDLIRKLHDAKVISIEQQFNNYDLELLKKSRLPREQVKTRLWIVKKLVGIFGWFIPHASRKFSLLLNVPIDQTATGALAQIQIILKKIVPEN